MRRFTVLQRGLHWIMAVAILTMLFVGVGMVATVAPAYPGLITWHRTLGIVILALVVLRALVRLSVGAPKLPRDLPAPMRLAAAASHIVLYALMFAMPLLGWTMLSAGNYPVELWGGVRLPSILPVDESMHTLLWNAHRSLAFVFFAVILLHLAAGMFHALIRRDGVFETMAPVSDATAEPALRASEVL